MLSSKVGRLLVPDRAYGMERYGGDPVAMPFRPVFDFTTMLNMFQAAAFRKPFSGIY